MIRIRLKRSGFTLIEMMVAMALSLGIMLILTESFKMALDFVRSAHSTGEMISQLNGAGILLTRDLNTDHFRDPKTLTNGPKLSDQRLDQPGWPPSTDGGFFRVVAPAVAVETTDPQGFSIYGPAVNHQLHFTSIIPPSAGGSGFTAVSNSAFYNSETAEIAYFLAPMGKRTSVGAGGQDLYNLIRRERLVAKTTAEQPTLAPAAADTNVISAVGPNVNTMIAVMNPANRMALAPFPPGTPRYGDDIVVSNVLSFELQADWTPGAAVAPPRAFATNTDAPFDFLPAASGGVFDTGVTPTPPMMARIKSLQVTIRIYDPRLKQSRQNTWKFAM